MPGRMVIDRKTGTLRPDRRRNRKSLADRFWSKVTDGPPATCWPWTGSITSNGYGQIGSGGGDSRPLSAHRVAWELENGPIPAPLWVLHRCDNRRCVNPGHLFLGDHDANMADMASKGRSGRSKLTIEQVQRIRQRRAGRGSITALAREFGVSASTVSGILTGANWRHV